MRNLVFFVNDASWLEHNRVGIAGINDPAVGGGAQANSARQKAIAEIAGITPGDRIFFRLGRSGEHPTQIVGLFTATSEPYFDPNPLFPGAVRVDHRLSLRVEFDCFRNYPNPVDIEHLWLSKERGSLWTIQQARGDVIGRHACVSITTEEADLIVRLLEANNPVHGTPVNYLAERVALGITGIKKISLPIDVTESPTEKPHSGTPSLRGFLGKYPHARALQRITSRFVWRLHRSNTICVDWRTNRTRSFAQQIRRWQAALASSC